MIPASRWILRRVSVRRWVIVPMLWALGACEAQDVMEPVVEDDTAPSDFNPGNPPPESGANFHLMFDGVDDRVLVPWHSSFPTEVFTIASPANLNAR